jgi:uncharacterized membrane protein
MTTTLPVRDAHALPPGRLDWLAAELVAWQADGLVSPGQSAAILGRYRAGRRFSLGRLLLTVGALFVGVGLIWLVAANLDAWPPLVRFVVVGALWLAALVTGEALHARRVSAPVVGAVRLLAALGFGAVVFQAAQGLQVPAHEPALVGVWALGALTHAYAARARLPLLVGLVTGTTWLLLEVLDTEPSGLAVVLGLVAAGVLAVSVGALHLLRLPAFAPAWREVGASLLLGGLFAAALPFVGTDGFRWTPWLAAALAAAGLAATAAALLSPGRGRLETLGALAVAAAALGLVCWDAGSDADGPLTADAVAQAAVSVVVYVAVAVALAALGTLRDSPRLTGLATAALVVFTTFQSFAVFARIVTGAWLFLLLGVVFLATGVLFDRARRQIAATLEPATLGPAPRSTP